MTAIICKGCKNYSKENEKCNINQIIIKNRREEITPLTPDGDKCDSFKGKGKAKDASA